jgi:hypothetical protein
MANSCKTDNAYGTITVTRTGTVSSPGSTICKDATWPI